MREVGAFNVGELWLSPGDNMAGIKAAVRRAAIRVGVDINIWDVSGNIYFKAPGAKRGRISRLA